MIFAQQAKGLELSKVQVLSRPIDSAIDPLAITLFIEPLDGDQGVSQERATEKLQQLVACRKPMLLRPIALVARPLFTQSLVLRFSAEVRAELHLCFSQLRDRSAAELGYQFDLHLSLLYSQDHWNLRKELAQQLQLPLEPLLFEGVSAVFHLLTINSPTEIGASPRSINWRCLHHAEDLGGVSFGVAHLEATERGFLVGACGSLGFPARFAEGFPSHPPSAGPEAVALLPPD